MAWKTILAFVDGSQNGLARAVMAAELAEVQGAALELCAPALMPAPLSSDKTLFAELVERASALAREDAGRALQAIRRAAPESSMHVVADTPDVTLGDVRNLAAARGRLADLVVLGQPIAADASPLDDLVFEGALFGAGAPCLVLPRWDAPRVWGRRILIAWKSSREAARAVREAMPLLQRADAVGVYHFAEAPEADSDVDALAQHLDRHGVRIDQALREGGAGIAGEAILAAAGGFGADLVVMGGYGHSRLRETVFGGATRTLTRFSQTALFLSH